MTGASSDALLIDTSGAEQNQLEGDWGFNVNPADAQALSGVRYDATSDVAVVASYEACVYARAQSGTVAVRFRALRDSTVIATTTVTLTSAWQRISLSVPLTSLGTNRYFEVVTDVATTGLFTIDALHCVRASRAIKRDLNAGTATPTLVSDYHESGATLLADLLRSEPGFGFMRMGPLLLDGPRFAFRDINSRFSGPPVARWTVGDGDGLPLFETIATDQPAMERYRRVEVRSRGTPLLAATTETAWELNPYRALNDGDVFRANYSGPFRRILQSFLDGASDPMTSSQGNFGTGHDIEVTTSATPAQARVDGLPYTYPSEESLVVREDLSGDLPTLNTLQVDMPFQDTNSAAMATEAQRLLDKYKNRVLRCDLVLGQRTDEVQAYQIGAEINDLIVVRANEKSYSPGFAKKFWVEGIEHSLDGATKELVTTLHLEEA